MPLDFVKPLKELKLHKETSKLKRSPHPKRSDLCRSMMLKSSPNQSLRCNNSTWSLPSTRTNWIQIPRHNSSASFCIFGSSCHWATTSRNYFTHCNTTARRLYTALCHFGADTRGVGTRNIMFWPIQGIAVWAIVYYVWEILLPCKPCTKW